MQRIFSSDWSSHFYNFEVLIRIKFLLCKFSLLPNFELGKYQIGRILLDETFPQTAQ